MSDYLSLSCSQTDEFIISVYTLLFTRPNSLVYIYIYIYIYIYAMKMKQDKKPLGGPISQLIKA